MIQFNIDDIIKFKKPHPCGGYEWKVKRIGVDMKLECTKCGRVIMIPRVEVLKRIKIDNKKNNL